MSIEIDNKKIKLDDLTTYGTCTEYTVHCAGFFEERAHKTQLYSAEILKTSFKISVMHLFICTHSFFIWKMAYLEVSVANLYLWNKHF